MATHQLHLDGILEFHNLPAHIGLRAADRKKIASELTAFLPPKRIRVFAVFAIQHICAVMDVRAAAGWRKRHNLAGAHLRR